MVFEIRISNFFSILEEVSLDLKAANLNSANSKSLTDNVFEFNDMEVLKSVAIYGANASGKSNLIKAIRFCNAMVFESHQHNENTVYNFEPFKFLKGANKPSTYFIHFAAEGVEYEYSFSLNRHEILTESLYYYPNGRRAKVFERDEKAGKAKKDKYSFGTGVIKRPLDVAESTSSKTLFISRASQMDRDIAKTIFTYFHEQFILNSIGYSSKNLNEMILEYKDLLLKSLKMADSDIVDFKHKVNTQKGKNLKANILTEEVSFEEIDVDNLEIKTYHKSAPNVPFNFLLEESQGTKKLFFIMLTILDVVKNNKVLMIDEIEDSLHPHIVDYIIRLFHSESNAQLIFTTHNTNLLNLNKFRKDQICFVNKKENGSSDLYSLFDYNDFRDTMDLEKAYLQGRFDAVPIINDATENIHHLVNG